jgi:hypothetical protein
MRLPNEPKKGESVRQKIVEMLRFLRSSTITGGSGCIIRESPNGRTIEVPKVATKPSGARSVEQPFEVRLTTDNSGESPVFSVIISPGYVIERKVINIAADPEGDPPVAASDCLTYHLPDGIFDESNDPKEHVVTNNQAAFVKVDVDDQGMIEAAEIVVDEKGKKSTHYVPPVGDETAGTPGEYYYKLAEFATDGDTLAITRFHARSHIDHFQELPRFVKAGGDAEIFKTFDAEEGKYKTRGITAGAGITVTQREDDIEVKTTGEGVNVNLEVEQLQYANDGTIYGSHTLHKTLYFRDGRLVAVGEPSLDPEPEGDDVKTVVTTEMVSAA